VAETPSLPNIGFLTVLQEASGFVGGYLVTNGWGRPLEFRLSTAVQPNRVQQIIYGSTLEPYLCADVIGKTLLDKTSTPVQLLVTDRQPVLELRPLIQVPLLWLAATDNAQSQEHHPRFPQDSASIRGLLQRLDDTLDLAEPFGRIREAIGEARKLGMTGKN
jgi:hypothetical protein